MKHLFLALILPMFASCAPTTFKSTKSETLGKSVFDGDQASGVITQPGGETNGVVTQPGGQATGLLTQPFGGIINGLLNQPIGGLGSGQITQGTTTGVPVKFICSWSEVGNNGTSLSAAPSVNFQVKDVSGAVVCDKTAGVKEYIMKNKALDLASCNLTGNEYTAKLVDPSKPSKELFYSILVSAGSFMQNDHIKLNRANASAPWVASSVVSGIQSGALLPGSSLFAGTVGVLWASNPTFDGSVEASTCDTTASPLVVNMTPKGQPDLGMQLSSPQNGVLFDILGLNAYPIAHTKNQISWIRNPNYMFLALPRAGRVDGIDELFGNNTFGPDYGFADNGFAALAKYDDNHDGVIDDRDEVFAELRFWSDKDFNSVTGRGELKSLRELGVTSIDLKYDPDYFERDQFGNESRMRSTVTTSDGQMHMIFDLWFVIQ